MNTEQVTKALGLIALLGGAARIGMAPSAAIWGVDSGPELAFGLVACLLMGIGIFGVHLHQSHRAGILGFVSVVLISISSTLTAALVWTTMLGATEANGANVGAMQAVNSLTALIGMIGFAVATARARVYPIWTLALYLAFPVLSFVPVVTDWSTVLWGLSYVGLGYYAFAGKTKKQAGHFQAAA
ncbi:hypothetical protein [Paenibacillus sp.]|uniref:hypothetical protein n=1 Tax=Paenibacillus sp. TaxID=58172 RepID=UPI002810BCD9|nr:hypothetical protein [Paenibacillus sp.]